MDKPFGQELEALLAERDMSQRELARQTRRRDGWGSTGTISLIVRGELPATLEAMEECARALHVNPSIWAEYRMAALRRDLDPQRAGWKSALKKLRELER